VAGPTTIYVAEHQDGLTPAEADELAAALAAAAQLALVGPESPSGTA
jgi:hypothetical protein